MLIFRDRYISLFSDLAKVDAPKDENFFDNLKTNTSKLIGDFKKLQVLFLLFRNFKHGNFLLISFLSFIFIAVFLLILKLIYVNY